MDMRINDRPHYPSREGLAHFMALNTALWIFDVDRHAMWWANPRAVAFWRAHDLDALLARASASLQKYRSPFNGSMMVAS